MYITHLCSMLCITQCHAAILYKIPNPQMGCLYLGSYVYYYIYCVMCMYLLSSVVVSWGVHIMINSSSNVNCFGFIRKDQLMNFCNLLHSSWHVKVKLWVLWGVQDQSIAVHPPWCEILLTCSPIYRMLFSYGHHNILSDSESKHDENIIHILSIRMVRETSVNNNQHDLQPEALWSEALHDHSNFGSNSIRQNQSVQTSTPVLLFMHVLCVGHAHYHTVLYFEGLRKVNFEVSLISHPCSRYEVGWCQASRIETADCKYINMYFVKVTACMML